MNTQETIFFLGKGGTGKSTTSSLLSLMLSQKGKKVLLASFDYAHNQSDIFEKEFSDRPSKVTSLLDVLQIDKDKEIKRYLKKTLQHVKRSYAYLTAFNLDQYFDILKFSPGMEEYALVTAFLDIRKKYNAYDYLIIDMPPTAVALKFFYLPSLSLRWIEQLEKLRIEIYRKKEIISKIKFAGKEIERDKILSRIQDIKKKYSELKDIFADKENTGLYTIFNPDFLSVAETKRIIEELNQFNIDIKGLICNNRLQTDIPQADFSSISSFGQIRFLPFSRTPLIGDNALRTYIETHNLEPENILT